MKKLNLDNLSREDARKLIMELPRKKAFVTDVLKNGTKVYFTTDGEKESKKDGRPLRGHYDIKVHFEGEPKRKFSYINDIGTGLDEYE